MRHIFRLFFLSGISMLMLDVHPVSALTAMESFSRDLKKVTERTCLSLKLTGCRAHKSRRHGKATRNVSRKTSSSKSETQQAEAKPQLPDEKPVKFVPLPRPKPIGVVLRDPVKEPAPVALGHTAISVEAKINGPAEAIPVPTPKPGRVIASVPKSEVVPRPSLPLPPTGPRKGAIASNCYEELAGLGVEFSRVNGTPTDSRCYVIDPVKLTSITDHGNIITFPDHPLLNCRFAVAFSQWTKGPVEKAVSSRLNGNVKSISTGPGYECRGRNGDASAKISEHGFGNAVDVMILGVTQGDKLQVAGVGPNSTANNEVLQEIRKAGCIYFTTVLGPGSNKAHKNHFHFDLAKHGTTGNYRICE